MKNLYPPLACIQLLLLFSILPAGGQEPPLKPTGYFDRSEIILVWDEGTTNGAKVRENNLKLRFNYQGFDLGERFTGGGQVVSDTFESHASRQIDLVSGDFNGDRMADYLYTKAGRADSLHLVLAYRSMTLHYGHRQTLKFPGKVLEGKHLEEGDLDGDGISEFATAYLSMADNTGNVALFGLDEDSLKVLDTLRESTSKNDLVLSLCDLDGNGDDELVLGYTLPQSPGNYKLKIFDFEGGNAPVEKYSGDFDLGSMDGEFSTVALTGVDLDGNGREEIVIAFTRNEHDQPNNPDTYLFTGGTGGALDAFAINYDQVTAGRYNYGGGWQITLKSGDLNGDSIPDVLLGCYRGVEIFQPAGHNGLEYRGSANINGFQQHISSVNYFDVADVTGDDLDDIVAVNHFFSYDPNGYQSFSIRIVQYDSTFRSTVVENVHQFARIDNGGGGGMHRTHYAVSLSDFDGDLFRIGEHTSLGCFTDVVRPVTVLYTPPVHIDYIDGVVHDVNECFGQNDCASSVQKYTENFSQDEYSIETSSKGDWGYDPSVSLGIDQELGDLGVGVHMSPVELSSLFGGNLEDLVVDVSTTEIGKTVNSSYFQTSSMDTRYSRDDAILTIVNDYERWEYPVYNQYESLLGEIVILIPRTKLQENWLRGRQALELSGMVQQHEPGNLLSYRKFYENEKDLMEANPDIREIIAIANPHELDLNSTYTETITWGKEFENSNVSVENTVETNPTYGINFAGFQPRVGDKSVAEEEKITSHTYRVGENLGIEVYGSSLAGNSYEYRVKPYYYWSVSGALVVDYMIDLSAGSFWSENYSTQDPGFLLPNRLDSLKVKNEIDRITDPDQYLLTPSIFMEPAIPVNGDTVSIGVLVHNLSLTPTSGPVEVSFYLGDPDLGGKLISDMEGRTVFTTGAGIEDQHYAIINFHWKAEFKQGDRFYALIDPAGKLAENREDNNKAWVPVQRFASCGESPSSVLQSPREVDFRERFRLYPNPADDLLTLEYSGPHAEDVVVSVTGLGGQILDTRMIPLGSRQGRIPYDVSSLAPGIYIVSMHTWGYQQHSRIIVE